MSKRVRNLGPADDHWYLLVRGLQVFLGAAALRGAAAGSPDLLINSLVGLLVTLVPDVLERRWGIPVAPALSAWVAVAAALHVAGMVFGFYGPTTGYDDLTHAVSGSFLGGAGVVVLRLWERQVPGLVAPPAFTMLVALAVVGAGGVAWEVVEFAADGGSQAVQLSLADTLSDLLFNLVGGLVTIGVGWASLDRIASRLDEDLGAREAE